MSTLSFNTDLGNTAYNNSNRDVLSAFRQASDKNLTIQQGMSINEISEVVSEKVITAVKKQFEATKSKVEGKANS